MSKSRRLSRSKRLGAAAATLPAVVVLAACSASSAPPSSSSGAVAQDPSAQVVVWTDSTREPGLQEYQKTHPSVKMKIVTLGGSSLLTKIELDNRAGSGWPDLVFDEQPNDAAALASSLYDFAEPLSSLVPASVRRGFGATLASCTINGQLDCLRNDLAQTVLWYNKPLMAQFGYQVPTTWAQYEQLGLSVAKDHPGYIIGAIGDQFSYYDYFWASGCPLQDVTAPNLVNINVADSRCTRVASMLDSLIKAGSVSTASVVDPSVIKLGQQQKILMLPGPSWFGDFIFKPASAYNTPAGVLAAAPYPAWDTGGPAYSGNAGGGIWVVSRHSTNLRAAANIATWMSTSNTYQATAATYPAYGPAAKAWGIVQQKSHYFATNPMPVLQAAAALINPVESPTRYDVENSYIATVVQSVKSGATIVAGLASLQSQLEALANSAGYAVK